MKPTLLFRTLLGGGVTLLALSGCATPGASQDSTMMSGGSGGMMAGGSDGKMSMMDMKSMCEMHNKMMSSKTAEERKTLMDTRMKDMSLEMREKHMAMMMEKCK